MNTVKTMLDVKGREVWSTSPDNTVFEAVQLMEQQEVGALTVLDGDGKLIGIVSERDCARKIVLTDRSSRETKVSDIMTKNVIVVQEDSTVDHCMAQMSIKKIRHLPVMNGDVLDGVIAVGDVLKFVIREQAAVIEELENYVMDETGGSG